MRRILSTFGLVLLTFAGIAGQTPRGAFDLKAWNVVGDANWSVMGDVVQADKGTGFLVTPMTYGDVHVTAEFWVTDDANSGVFVRCTDPKMITADNAYEVNIFDKRPDQTYRTGAIVNVAKPLATVNTGGKWNTIDITAKGPKFTVAINGVTTVRESEDRKHARGAIALQYGAGTVRFRNVRISPL